MYPRSIVTLLSLVALGSLTCARDQNESNQGPPATVGVTNAQPGSPIAGAPDATTSLKPEVIEYLAQTWCERGSACNRVSAATPYPTFHDCLVQMRAAVRDDLGALSCVQGMDWDRVASCARSITQAACQPALATLVSLEPCRSDLLCAP